MRGARQHGQAVKCLGQIQVLSEGLVMYTTENVDVLIPGRLPRVDDCTWFYDVRGGRKYRPTFLAMMIGVGVPPFDDPMACRNLVDRFGEKGERQNYSSDIYVCPSVATWRDERNGCYGYNYQFLGNSRLADPSVIDSFKRWPVSLTHVRFPADTLVMADAMGTAASFAPSARRDYEDNASDADRFGNEGFNLDPPRVDPASGEMAGLPDHRTAADPRHRKRSAVLWLDGHGDYRTPQELGYRLDPDGSYGLDGDNRLWSGNHKDVAWTPDFTP
jgi:prepilin-type processing-associated H-X9-DG protein